MSALLIMTTWQALLSALATLFSNFKLNTNNLKEIKTFVNSLEIFQIGVSWGGHESLIYAPAISYLKELNPEQFKGLGISLGDMRISVGLEDADDLISDLDQALKTIH